MNFKTYEAWRADVMTCSAGIDLQLTEGALRRLHGQGCDPQMIRTLRLDQAVMDRSLHEVDGLYAERTTIRAYRDSRPAH